MRIIPVQAILIPLSLVFSTLLFAAGWGHTSVHETSPILGTAEAVQKWADHEARARQCLPWSVDIETIQEDAIPTDPGKGHWYAELRCNRHSIYVQWAILILAPWLIMNAVLILFNWLIPSSPKAQGYDYFR
jgi:hypothetical protein